MMKKALVIGFGISGKSAAEFLSRRGWCVVSHDDKQGAEKFEGDLRGIDLVVVSPGVPKTHPLYVQAIEWGIELVGEVELALQEWSGPVIAITGTNGKTTVSELVAHTLRHAGKGVRLLGNGGVPITSEIEGCQGEIIVLELSSFQLETMKSPSIDAAVVLNITPDHLDRYEGMEEYARAKMDISRCMKPDGVLFVEEGAFQKYGYLLEGFPCQILAPGGSRGHDQENYLAAFALCRRVGVEAEQIEEAYKSFKKPPHRIEFVGKIGGVSYYDDSKGTNIDAVIRCIQSLRGPIILIAGGVDKGFPYTGWIEPFQGKVKGIMTIGQAAEKIERELGGYFLVKRCRDLEEAIGSAKENSTPGDNIVLSPGCASYDMFKSYAHRGDEFKRLVLKGGS